MIRQRRNKTTNHLAQEKCRLTDGAHVLLRHLPEDDEVKHVPHQVVLVAVKETAFKGNGGGGDTKSNDRRPVYLPTESWMNTTWADSLRGVTRLLQKPPALQNL